MARIEWMRLRLENWARWMQQSETGGLGFPRQSTFVRLAGVGARHEAVVPLDSIDAGKMNDAINALQGRQSDLYLVLQLVYAKGLPRQQVARRMAVTERTVSAKLERADHALVRWFEDRSAAVAQRAGG